MQSFRGSIRLVQRQSISSSNNVDLKSIKGYPLIGGTGFSSNASNSNGLGFSGAKFSGISIGSSKACFLGSLSMLAYGPPMTRIGSQAEMAVPSTNGIPSISVSCRSSWPNLFQWAAVIPPFTSRCITTVGNPVESASQDSSVSVSDVAPRIKFKRLDKTAKHIMQILDKEAVEDIRAKREIPDIKPGYIVQLKVEVPQNKRRVSIIKGIVIARRNAGLNTTFRIRRLVAGVGVEYLFPLYSPNIKEIKVLDKKKVRRAKLYYLRDKMNALKKQ